MLRVKLPRFQPNTTKAAWPNSVFLALGWQQRSTLTDASGYGERGSAGWGNGAPGGYHLHGSFVTDAPPSAGGPMGMGLAFDGAANFLHTEGRLGLAAGASPDESFLVVCSFGANSGDRVLAGYFASGFGVEEYGRGLVLSGGVIKAAGVSASNGKVISSGITPTVGQTYVIGGRFSADGALFVNGSKFAAGDISHSWTYRLCVGAAASAYPLVDKYFEGRCYFAHGEQRGWTDAELARYTRDPRLLWPPRRVIVPHVSAGSAVPSITAVYADSVTATSVVPRVTLDFA